MIMLLWSIDRCSMKDVHSSKNVLVLSPLRADIGGRQTTTNLIVAQLLSVQQSLYSNCEVSASLADDDVTFSDSSVLKTIPTPPPVLPLLRGTWWNSYPLGTNTGGINVGAEPRLCNTRDVIVVRRDVIGNWKSFIFNRSCIQTAHIDVYSEYWHFCLCSCFSWLNKMFPSTTTIHLYYYQCRWHTVDINGVRCRQSALNQVN